MGRKNYARVIRELRTVHDLNLVEIGRRIGIDPRTVGKWGTGKHKPNRDSRKRLNKLYKEVKQTMTTQVSIFEEVNDQGQVMQVIATRPFYGHQLEVYGDFQEPWFLAKDIAEMIDYSTASLNKFLQSVDEDEKGRKNVPTLGGVQKAWFLTEQGLYEVLFQSRKPKAKEFKKWVKQILKEIRLNGYYMQGELIQEQQTAQTAPELPQGLREVERLYMDTLAQEITKTDDMATKMQLAERLTQLVQSMN